MPVATRTHAVITIDQDKGVVHVGQDAGRRTLPMSDPAAFEVVSAAWLRCGWDVKHVYSFTWLGRPIIQLPEDMIRIQELIYQVRPTLIIETGIAHGGSLVFSASLCKLMGQGRVIGVDVEIRPHNLDAIESHELADLITLIEGDSIAEDTLQQVRALVQPDDRVMVLLDSCHAFDHVLSELRAYGPLVSKGSYIIAMDGIMGDLTGAPRTEDDWKSNNPRRAASAFCASDERFELCEPPFAFNEGAVRSRVTYSPDGIIKRIN